MGTSCLGKVMDISGHGHVPRRTIRAKLIIKTFSPFLHNCQSASHGLRATPLRLDMQTCRRFQHCLELRAERERKSPDMAVIDACRCYHRSLDITAPKGRRTHPSVAEQLWPGSRLACRATSFCTPSGRRLADDLRLARLVPRPTHLARTRASNCRRNAHRDNNSDTNSSPAPPPTVPLGVAWPPSRNRCHAAGRSNGNPVFSPAAGCSGLFLTMETVFDEFSLTGGGLDGYDAPREARKGEPAGNPHSRLPGKENMLVTSNQISRPTGTSS